MPNFGIPYPERREPLKEVTGAISSLGETLRKYKESKAKGLEGEKRADKDALDRLYKEIQIRVGLKSLEQPGFKEAQKIKMQQKIQTEKRKAGVDYGKVKSLLGRLISQKKAQLEETGGAGMVMGRVGRFAGQTLKVGKFASSAAFEGQRKETAAAMMRIISGQNRFVQSLYQAIVTTLPDAPDTAETMTAKVEQSIRNAYGLIKAVQASGVNLEQYSEEELKNPDSEINKRIRSISPTSLTPQEEKDLEATVKTILETPIAKKRKVSKFGELLQNNKVIKFKSKYALD